MNLFKLVAKIGLDSKDYEKGLDESERKTKSFGHGAGGAFKTFGSVAVKALTVAATGIATITALSIKNYAEYEQLVGGVETLFKKNSDEVVKYAQNAYKTAGLSANQYMDTITSFSASLLQSLDGDTKKAAEVGNRAIVDMSD